MEKTLALAASKSHAVIEGDDSQDREMGLQFTALYESVVDAMPRQLLFGAMMMHLRERLESARDGSLKPNGFKKLSRGRNVDKGGGVSGWLEKYAPTVPPSNARRFEACAIATAKLWNGLPGTLQRKIGFPDLITKPTAELAAIDRRLPKKQEEAIDFAKGHGQKGLLDAFVEKYGRGGNQYERGGKKGKRPTTSQLERESLLLSAQVWKGYPQSLATQLEARGFTRLNEADLSSVIDAFSSAVTTLRQWQKTPQIERDAPARAALVAASKKVK